MALNQRIVTTDLTLALTNGNNDPNDSELGLQISIPRVETEYLDAANCWPVSGRAAWTEFDLNNDLDGEGGMELTDVNVNATTRLGWEGEAEKNEHRSIVTAVHKSGLRTTSTPNSELPWHKKDRDELAKLLSGEELPMKETIDVNFNDGSNGDLLKRHAPFDSPENSCAQLTMFYAGTVSVYDNIAADQARAIMNFAGTSNSCHVNSLRSLSKQVSNTSNAISSSSNRENLPGSNPSLLYTVSPLRTRRILPLIPTSMQNNSPSPRTLSSRDSVQPADKKQQELIKMSSSCQYVVSRTLPIARKASLARFLEKRQERIKSIVPYPEKDSCQELQLQKGRELLSSNSGTVFYDETLSIHTKRYLGSKHKLQDASVCQMDVQDQSWVGTAEYAEQILQTETVTQFSSTGA